MFYSEPQILHLIDIQQSVDISPKKINVQTFFKLLSSLQELFMYTVAGFT